MTNYSPKTGLEYLFHYLTLLYRYFTLSSIDKISMKLFCLLGGFFISAGLSTVTVHSGNWNIIATLMIVIGQEIFSQIVYSQQISLDLYSNYFSKKYFTYFNNIKIGLLYGLFVDAFKLGS